jgi:hypothetical protein
LQLATLNINSQIEKQISMTTIQLEKGIIHLILPFRLCSGVSSDFGNIENEVWARTNEDIPRLDFLLEHVKKFFAGNADKENADGSACVIMKLKTDSLPVKMFNNKTFWLSNRPYDNHQKTKNLLKYAVNLDPSAFRIVFHPFTKIAILIYSIELVKQNKNSELPNLDDFIKMNYLLRLFNRHDEAYFIAQNERPEERNKAGQLNTGKSDLFHKNENGNIEQEGWRPRQLINYLLQDINTSYSVELFDNFHFSPVCYLQPSDEIKDEDIIHHALFYLRKVYDFDYKPASNVLQREEELLHPYRQIYYASSLEGAVVLNNCSSSDPEFIRIFYSNSFHKTLWLTILGFLQRSIFLQLMKEVSDINPDDHQKIKEYLKRYTSISLKAIFSKVSVFHQHNDYYDLIIHNLQINELQTELKDELHELNNLQRQFHEDEVEKHDEIEKQYDKKLNMILFALSVFGLTQVTYSAIGATNMSFIQHALAIGIPVILGIVFWQMLISRRK